MLGLGGGGKKRWRRRGDPLRLTRELKRGKGSWNAVLRDPVNDITNLHEGIYCRGSRDQCEKADPEKSQQQAATYPKALKHGRSVAGSTWS